MFNLIFWGIILAVAFTGVKRKFLYSLCVALAFLFAFYFSFWELEPITALMTLLPLNLDTMARPLVLLLLFAIAFALFRYLMLMSESVFEKNFPDEGEIFPTTMRYCGAFIANLLTGATLATLLFTVIAVTPAIKTIPMFSSPEISQKAVGGIRFISGFVDILTWQKRYPQERERLMRKTFDRPTPEESQFFQDLL